MFLDYPTFATLLKEAKEYQDIDMYIAERGWQDWMNPFDADEVAKILRLIYRMGGMSLRDIRTEMGYSRTDMSRLYGVASVTIQGWEYGKRNAPDYVMALIYYTFFMQKMNKENNVSVTVYN